MIDVIEKIKKEGFRRRLSHRTVVAYVYWVKRFFGFCKKDHIEISKKDVREFIYFLSEKGLSGSTLNVALMSIVFMLKEVLNKNWKLNIKYSKQRKSLPDFLTVEEIKKLIFSINNKKHRLMISILYSAGLRVSELVNLRVRDLDFDNCYGWVRHGKGNKDRLFIIADGLKEGLISHIKECCFCNDSYLFPGRNGWHLSVRTVQEIIKQQSEKLKISKNCHPHTLRHSFATYIIENKNSLSELQNLLGHNSPETTFIYTHCAVPTMIRAKSPYDNMIGDDLS